MRFPELSLTPNPTLTTPGIFLALPLLPDADEQVLLLYTPHLIQIFIWFDYLFMPEHFPEPFLKGLQLNLVHKYTEADQLNAFQYPFAIVRFPLP